MDQAASVEKMEHGHSGQDPSDFEIFLWEWYSNHLRSSPWRFVRRNFAIKSQAKKARQFVYNEKRSYNSSMHQICSKTVPIFKILQPISEGDSKAHHVLQQITKNTFLHLLSSCLFPLILFETSAYQPWGMRESQAVVCVFLHLTIHVSNPEDVWISPIITVRTGQHDCCFHCKLHTHVIVVMLSSTPFTDTPC